MMKTWSNLVLIILMICAEASDFSGASAQSVSPHENRSGISSSSDTIPDENLLDIISILTTTSDDSLNMAEADADTHSILDNIISQGKKPQKKPVSSARVLDFMTEAYSQHDFYQSGNWDDAEDFSYITNNVVLPPYDPRDFYRPSPGRITSTYGYREKFGRVHKGIDLALSIGDTVRAALPGVVARVGYDKGGYGHCVVMVHNNGMETRYAHLQAPVTAPGETIAAGQPVGLGGNTGNSTGPHLHFEIRYRGTAVDPASVFNFHRIPAPPKIKTPQATSQKTLAKQQKK